MDDDELDTLMEREFDGNGMDIGEEDQDEYETYSRERFESKEYYGEEEGQEGEEMDKDEREEEQGNFAEGENGEKESEERRKSSEVFLSITNIPGIVETESEKNRHRVRHSSALGFPGIARIDISPMTQKIVGCLIGENVTTEYPWVYASKEIMEDNLDLHSESSDFLPVKEAIETYPEKRMLIGYAPSTYHPGQFYICLTIEGRDMVMKHIQERRKEHEEKVKNAVYKRIGTWEDLGSGREIDDTIVKNARPLLQVEVVTKGDVIFGPMNLVNRNADDQRDGYIELLPYRQKFDNVARVLISRAEQVMPTVCENSSQTELSVPANNFCQYEYEYTPIDPNKFTEIELDNLRIFLDRYTDMICNEVQINATWDIYSNDYANLANTSKHTQAMVRLAHTDHQTYHEGNLVNDRVINDLSWHPLWSGIAIAAYTIHANSDFLRGPKEYDEVYRASHDENHVLMWSFSDCLAPKLVLKCPREVTAVAACPTDGSIIIGGCVNGQVVIWHTPGRIEQMEEVAIQTPTQTKYRIAMRSLMSWMREPKCIATVNPVAMSSFKESQKSRISQIVWLPAHQKITKYGMIQSLPESTALEDLSMQFASASEDGTIAFWDLRWRPESKPKKKDTQPKKKRISLPEPLKESESVYKVLNRVFKPEYILLLNGADRPRPVITSMSFYRPNLPKEQIEPFPANKQDITLRCYYKLDIKKPDYQMKNKIYVGTVDGQVGCVTWKGMETTSRGITVCREDCTWTWVNNIHDGVVAHLARSPYYPDILATVGGKIFAIWKESFSEPVIWKQSDTGKYTSCCWGQFRPTVLILGKMDGSVEIWDFMVKSHEPCLIQSLSGRIITGIYPHEIETDPPCLGFCDFKGSVRMMFSPQIFPTHDTVDFFWMKSYIDRQIHRKIEQSDWQEKWNQVNVGNILMKEKRARAETEMKRRESEQRQRAESAELQAKIKLEKKEKKRKPGQFLEDAKARWTAIEKQRMQRVILEKKGLRKDEIEKQRAPVLKLRQDALKKKKKLHDIMDQQDQIFTETVTVSLPPVKETDYTKRTMDVFTEQMAQKYREDYIGAGDATIITDYKEIAKEANEYMEGNRFSHSFNWRSILLDGKARRESIDLELHAKNKSTVLTIEWSEHNENLPHPFKIEN